MNCEVYDTEIPRHAAAHEVAGILTAYQALRAALDGPPPFEALREALADHASYLAVLEPCGSGDFRYTAYGSTVAGIAEFDMTGRRVSDLASGTGRALSEVYGRCLREGRPLLAVHRAIHARTVHLWERLILPCRARDGIARLIAFIRPREYKADVLNALLEASCDGILGLRAVRDPQGRAVDATVLTANRRAGDFIGYALDDLIGRPVLSLMPSLAQNGAWARCLAVIEERRTERFELQCDLDGLDTWLRVTAVPLGDGIMMSMSDVTELKYALFEMEVLKEEAERAKDDLSTEVSARQMVEGELRRIAITDGLTGVLNRRGFDDVVRTVTAAASRSGHALSVIAIDLDHFKRVNDLYGHAAGDTVLMTVAALLMEELRRDTDSISRVGGEEFMILLPQTPIEGAIALADRLRLRVASLPINVGETTLTMTASLGVRDLPDSGDAERMLIEADGALYEAKQAGRNCVVAWNRGVVGSGPGMPVPSAPRDARMERRRSRTA